MSTPNFNSLLDKIGAFGKFQKRAIASLSISQIFLAFANFGFVLFGYSPTEFRCIDPYSNTTGCQSYCVHYQSHDGYISYTIEWGLMCKKSYFLRLAQICHMSGLFVGAFLCGALADKYGRLRILYINLFVMCLLSYITIWLEDVYSFCFVTFLLGICCQGCGLTSYTLILETVGEHYRALCGILEQVFYAFGIALTALLAYYVPDWRNLATVFATCGPIAFIFMVPFHIESTRWLLTQPSKRSEAVKNLNYIRRVNGTQDDLTCLRFAELFDSDSSEYVETQNASGDKDPLVNVYPAVERISVNTRTIQREGFCTLFSHPLLRKWTLIFSICWFSNAAAYYGSTIVSGEAFKNRFLSFALSGLIEIPGHCLSPCLMNTYGRRKFHAYLQIIGGFFFSLVLPFAFWGEVAVLTVATLAKLCISMSFASAYVYASEAYPTSIINAAVGFCVTAGRLGGTVAPAFLLLGRNYSCLIFGAITLVSGGVALFLPETLGRQMPATSLQLAERS